MWCVWTDSPLSCPSHMPLSRIIHNNFCLWLDWKTDIVPFPEPFILYQQCFFSLALTFDVVMDDVVWVEVLQASQDLLGHPDDLKLPQWPTAVQLLQNWAALASLHEQVDALVPQQSTIQLSDILMAEAGLELHVSCLKVLHGDLWGWWWGVNKCIITNISLGRYT